MDSTLHAWKELFGSSEHDNPIYTDYGFGIIYDLDTIGYSSKDSLPIFAVKLSANVNERASEPKILILGQCHAEEIYGLEISMEIIKQFLFPDEYVDNKTKLQWGLYGSEVWVVPTHNPEGLRVVHGYYKNGELIKDVTYRKNKTDVNQNLNFDYIDGVGQDLDGVDLNRNYDFNWIFGDSLWVPGASCNPGYKDDFDYYRGHSPESEPETKAIVALAKKEKFLLSIAYHSSRSGCIDRYVIYPWAWKDKWGEEQKELAPGFDVIEKLASEIAEIAGMDLGQNYLQTGSSYRKGNAHDWFYRETGCVQFLVELGYTPQFDYGGGLLIQEEYIDEVINSNIDAFFHVLMRAVGNNYDLDLGLPPVDGNQVRGNILDANTNFPIENAIVSIPELENNITKKRTTDASGFYSRILHPDGEYTMNISAFGYELFNNIEIQHTTSGARTFDASLNKLSNYNLTLNITASESIERSFHLLRHHRLQSDTFYVSSDEIFTWPQGDYRIVLLQDGFIPVVKELALNQNQSITISMDSSFILNEINYENQEGVWYAEEGKVIHSINNINYHENLLLEYRLKYELEWDYDNLFVYQINNNDTITLMQYSGDKYQFFTEYIPISISNENASADIIFSLEKDGNIDYRGVEIDYIKLLTSENEESNLSIFEELPNQLVLFQNHPNPFNPSTKIKYFVPRHEKVTIGIYDIRGNFVEEIISKNHNPGYHTIIVNLDEYSSGIYLYRIISGNDLITKKLMIIK